MSSGNLLSIQPTDELKFPFQLKKQTSSSLRLTNNSDELYVAFKVKTTHPKKYSVRPNAGIILPGTTCEVTVNMQAYKEAPLDVLQCKEKFLVQSTVVQAGDDITPETFNNESGKVVEEFKLKVAYVFPVANHPMCSGNLLSIQPRDELKFPFQLKKQTSSSLQLTNNSDELYVAFKVKTTNLKKYCVRPNAGIVMPGTTCQVTVTMQAPLDMLQCKDKFLVQTTVVQAGDDITPETFNNEGGKVVEEFNFKVVYVFPVSNHNSAAGKAATKASFVENGSQPRCLFDAVARLIGLGPSRGDKQLHLCRDISGSSTAPLLANIY